MVRMWGKGVGAVLLIVCSCHAIVSSSSSSYDHVHISIARANGHLDEWVWCGWYGTSRGCRHPNTSPHHPSTPD
ncbi:hypothetical protein IWX90DRAFT_437421 [Phyllosticta citrichinensis]|uniref:Secreted protein n=1 Tax=Phyllosticta citrichinensis TaxID=1130410 RepID=A0ABR1XMC1_9PEZI